MFHHLLKEFYSAMLIMQPTVRDRVLHLSVTGEFTIDDAKQNFLEVVALIEEHQSEKILFDGRGVVGNPSLIERFYYGEFAADSVAQLKRSASYDADPQFAFVLQQPTLDPLRLGETVAINRGMNVRAFEDLHEAVQWLGVETD